MLVLKETTLIDKSAGFVEGNVDFGYSLYTTPDCLNVVLTKDNISVVPKSKNMRYKTSNLGKPSTRDVLGYFSNISQALRFLKGYMVKRNIVNKSGDLSKTIHTIQEAIEKASLDMDKSIEQVRKYYEKHETVKNLNLED